MRKFVCILTVAAAAGGGGLAACSDPLSVQNKNNPGTEQVLLRPADVEQLIGSGYNAVHQGTLGGTIVVGGAGANDNVQNQLQVLGLENYSTLANFGMGPRGGLPRIAIQNYRNNPVASGNFRDFSVLERTARSAADGISRFNQAGFTLGDTAKDFRAKSFGYFVLGTALGNAALVYDSLAIVSPETPFAEVQPFVGYAAAMQAAIADLDSAISFASRPGAAAGFPLPATWINGNPMSQSAYVAFVRSYRARFRAEVARTPVERKAADWDKIIADAEAGITADVNVAMDPSANWTMAWTIQHYLYGSWHMMTPLIIGMADTTRAFDTWLAQPLGAKTPFLIRTPDKRFPPGETRAAQNTSSGGTANDVVPPGGQYFRNRGAGSDVFDNSWGNSFYDFVRFRAFFNANRIGNYPIMTKAEIDLLAAEGYIYKGNVAKAAPLIDKTRVTKGGLPALTGAVASVTDPVPGGNACVPRVPVGPTFTTTACGNIMEAMKWEKRMETAYTEYGAWYFDGRGWGDLPEGTALSFPVPYQELDTRQIALYTLGGLGGQQSAAKGTYGY